jgi:hypothetical protein
LQAGSRFEFSDLIRGGGWHAAGMCMIGDLLGSEETGEPFSHCVRCRLPLVEIAQPWLVSHEIQLGECVLEYAICQPCRDAVASQFSAESKEAVREFLVREIDWEARLSEFMLSHDMRERFAACIACRRPRGELRAYVRSAWFDSGGHLVSGPLPCLMCDACLVRMSGLLSAESQQVWRNFLEANFPGPPSDSGFSGFF